MTEATMDQCVAVKADGSRCATDWALSPEGLCVAHDPARSHTRREGALKSAEVRQAKAARRREGGPLGMPEGGQPRSLADAVAWSGWVAHAIATGTLDNRSGDSVIKSLAVLVTAVEKVELEREVAELRRTVRELKARSKQ